MFLRFGGQLFYGSQFQRVRQIGFGIGQQQISPQARSRMFFEQAHDLMRSLDGGTIVAIGGPGNGSQRMLRFVPEFWQLQLRQ